MFRKTTDSIQEYEHYTLDAVWSDKSTIFSVTFHRSRRGFAPEANVAAIGRPKMALLGPRC